MIARATMSRWAMPPERWSTSARARSASRNRSEHLLGHGARSAVTHAEVTTVEVQVLVHVERAVERVRLRDDADDLLGEGRVRDDVDPADRGGAAVGMTRVVSMPTVVVLPAPFGPSSPKISPSRTVRSSPSTARTTAPRPPKTLVSPTVRMTSSDALGRDSPSATSTATAPPVRQMGM